MVCRLSMICFHQVTKEQIHWEYGARREDTPSLRSQWTKEGIRYWYLRSNHRGSLYVSLRPLPRDDFNLLSISSHINQLACMGVYIWDEVPKCNNSTSTLTQKITLKYQNITIDQNKLTWTMDQNHPDPGTANVQIRLSVVTCKPAYHQVTWPISDLHRRYITVCFSSKKPTGRIGVKTHLFI